MAFKFDKKTNPLKKKGYISENPIKYDAKLDSITAASPATLNGNGNEFKLSYAYGEDLTPAQEKAAQELANKRASEIMQGQEFKTNDKGDLVRSAEFVHELSANRGAGLLSYKDKWDKMSDKEKAKHGSLDQFKIAGEAWWDSKKKKFKGYAEESKKKPVPVVDPGPKLNSGGSEKVVGVDVGETSVDMGNRTQEMEEYQKLIGNGVDPVTGKFGPIYETAYRPRVTNKNLVDVNTQQVVNQSDVANMSDEDKNKVIKNEISGLSDLNDDVVNEVGVTTNMNLSDQNKIAELELNDSEQNLSTDPLDEDFTDN